MKKLLIILAVALSGCAAMDMTNDAKFNERVQDRGTDMMETNRLKNATLQVQLQMAISQAEIDQIVW